MSEPPQPARQSPYVPVTYEAREALEVFSGGLGRFSKEIVGAVRELHAVADKGTSAFLMAFGATLLVALLFMHLKPFGIRVADIGPAEFITFSLFATLFVIGGAGIRLYQNVTEREFQRSLTQHQTRIIHEQQEHYLAALDAMRKNAQLSQTVADPAPRW